MTDGSRDEFEQRLVNAAKGAAMPAAKKRELMAALAGGVTLGVATTAQAAATSAVAKKGVGMALIKWVVAGVVGSAFVAGAASHAAQSQRGNEAGAARSTTSAARVHPTPKSLAPVAPSEPQAPGPEEVSKIASEPGEAREADAGILGVFRGGRPTHRPVQPQYWTDRETETKAPVHIPAPIRTPRVSAKARSALRAEPRIPTLADELAVIERAREAIASGDTAAAGAALAEHAREFPSGAFADEASVLRIDVLARRGDRARLETAARAYLDHHPNSPHAPRVRAYLGGGATP